MDIDYNLYTRDQLADFARKILDNPPATIETLEEHIADFYKIALPFHQGDKVWFYVADTQTPHVARCTVDVVDTNGVPHAWYNISEDCGGGGRTIGWTTGNLIFGTKEECVAYHQKILAAVTNPSPRIFQADELPKRDGE